MLNGELFLQLSNQLMSKMSFWMPNMHSQRKRFTLVHKLRLKLLSFCIRWKLLSKINIFGLLL